MKFCVYCEEFMITTSRHQMYCEVCKKNGTAIQRFKRFGLTKRKLDELIALQNGKCALCDRQWKRVDHDHITNVVRGLLCALCNQKMSILDKDRKWLERAEKYTQRGNNLSFKIPPVLKHWSSERRIAMPEPWNKGKVWRKKTQDGFPREVV